MRPDNGGFIAPVEVDSFAVEFNCTGRQVHWKVTLRLPWVPHGLWKRHASSGGIEAGFDFGLARNVTQHVHAGSHAIRNRVVFITTDDRGNVSPFEFMLPKEVCCRRPVVNHALGKKPNLTLVIGGILRYFSAQQSG